MKLTAKIGVIQLTNDRFRLLVVKTGGAMPKVLERIDEPLASLGDDPEVTHAEHVELIQQCIKKLKHSPTLYLLNTPQNWSVMRLLSVPFKGAKKVRSALTYELEPYLAIPIEDLAIDYITVGEHNGHTEVFVMGLKKERVSNQVALLNEAGIVIEGFGLDTVGLSALGRDCAVKNTQAQAIAFEHEGSSYVSVIRNRSLAFTQRLASTPDRVSAWGREVQNALRGFHATSLETVELMTLNCIGVTLDEEAQSNLEKQLDVDIVHHSWEQSGLPDEMLDADDASTWVSMAGAATSVAGGSFNIAFESTTSESNTQANPYTRSLMGLLGMVLIVLVAKLGIMHLKTQKNIEQTERLGQAVWEEFALAYPNDPQAKERPADDEGGQASFLALQEAIDKEQSTGTALTPQMFNQTSLPNILKEIAVHVPDSLASLSDVRVTPLSVKSSKLGVTIRGDAKNPDAYSKIVAGFEKSQLLDFQNGERSTEQGKLTFTLKLHVNDAPVDSQ